MTRNVFPHKKLQNAFAGEIRVSKHRRLVWLVHRAEKRDRSPDLGTVLVGFNEWILSHRLSRLTDSTVFDVSRTAPFLQTVCSSPRWIVIETRLAQQFDAAQ